jgi:D-glucosaminate-6-phosphate ammonia-lyase
MSAPNEPPSSATERSRDLLAELGVRRVVNAAGYYTYLGGAPMAPEVVDAWAEAARSHVRVDELNDAVGRRVAQLLGAEGALLTASAAAALTVGTAACIAGTDPERIRRLPDTEGMRNEVIVQRSHRFSYDHAVRACGIRLIEVETTEELLAAVSDRTAMLLFLNLARDKGRIGAAEYTALGRRLGLPTLVDCAADVPPLQTLTDALAVGFDLVVVSGGKAIGGPQNAGILLGRRELVEAARLNASPNSDVIGRGMKMNKETTLAMLVALERYVARDHAADWREWERRVGVIADAVSAVPGVMAEPFVPPIGSHSPHVCIRWDQAVVALSLADVAGQLRDGEPSIETFPVDIPPESLWAAIGRRDGLNIGVWALQPGEETVVARRLVEILGGAARSKA